MLPPSTPHFLSFVLITVGWLCLTLLCPTSDQHITTTSPFLVTPSCLWLDSDVFPCDPHLYHYKFPLRTTLGWHPERGTAGNIHEFCHLWCGRNHNELHSVCYVRDTQHFWNQNQTRETQKLWHAVQSVLWFTATHTSVIKTRCFIMLQDHAVYMA